jgi:hypothetical protein
MNTHDQAPGSALSVPRSPEKRTYEAPKVVDLGDVRELTRSGGTKAADIKGSRQG